MLKSYEFYPCPPKEKSLGSTWIDTIHDTKKEHTKQNKHHISSSASMPENWRFNRRKMTSNYLYTRLIPPFSTLTLYHHILSYPRHIASLGISAYLTISIS